ncbi:hypothetical protein [Brevundimonas sp. UBA7664]|uniref:hypothetical protein n=1 Tax=Brevundimonas sp. UBA7664 TaxID=1946141 RepID=UPI0025B954A7|nr:hypothetical protein [Brevundimonas sp. UBA7664]
MTLAGDEADWFGDDPTHPIPRIFVLDIHAKAADGAGQLELVIASPLRNDRRSKERLLRKLDVYLDFIHSEAWRDEHGPPARPTARINVLINRDSDSEMLELVESCRMWVEEDNHTSFNILHR